MRCAAGERRTDKGIGEERGRREEVLRQDQAMRPKRCSRVVCTYALESGHCSSMGIARAVAGLELNKDSE